VIVEFELDWIDSSRLVCRASGVASTKDYEEFLKALAAGATLGAGVKLLMDFRAVDISSVTAAAMEEVAGLRALVTTEINIRSAMVVGEDPLRYGLGRMFQSYATAQTQTEITLFRGFDEGLEWLKADDVAAEPDVTPTSRRQTTT
jgi:hypothetical protein